ncbi:MAG TPA: methyl-accepting chemotaxis protein [Desulfurivibrionaceae bacterium]|nr:methyl-accepting chemotaxis protein [Desulfurivibrionaceae bacterium]
MITKALDKLERYPVIPRVMIAVLTALAAALAVGTIIFSTFVQSKMTASYLDSVHTLFNSFEEGVKGSLERGQMGNFKKLLEQQKAIRGVIDVSLYDRTGKINLSSSGDKAVKARPPEFLQQMAAAKTTIIKKNGNTVQFLGPQMVAADCIRCHPTWTEGEVGGSLSLTYDLSFLTKTTRTLLIYLAVGSLGLLGLAAAIMTLVMRRLVSMPIDALIENLSGSAHKVGNSANEAASSSKSLADHASQQAASLEETSASLEEIAAMTTQNADNANAANDFMREATKVMADANHAMEQLTRAMAEISSSNEETSKIIKTIDEIAFQTNLLALNAAVEAARAGEAGAGFAVVADEVRNLAMRAADAAHETSQLLETTNSRVGNGVALVQSTDESFKKAAGQTQKTAEILAEIASASKEQSTGITQVSKAIHELDEVTQHNAADADQSSHVAHELETQARQLNEYMRGLIELVRGKQRA